MGMGWGWDGAGTGTTPLDGIFPSELMHILPQGRTVPGVRLVQIFLKQLLCAVQ